MLQTNYSGQVKGNMTNKSVQNSIFQVKQKTKSQINIWLQRKCCKETFLLLLLAWLYRENCYSLKKGFIVQQVNPYINVLRPFFLLFTKKNSTAEHNIQHKLHLFNKILCTYVYEPVSA